MRFETKNIILELRLDSDTTDITSALIINLLTYFLKGWLLLIKFQF